MHFLNLILRIGTSAGTIASMLCVCVPFCFHFITLNLLLVGDNPEQPYLFWATLCYWQTQVSSISLLTGS